MDSDHQAGRGYIIIHETNPELVIFDVDEGIYLEVHDENVFYLGKDHARIPAFAVQRAVIGVKPPALNLWNRETCESFADFIDTICLNFEVANVRGKPFLVIGYREGMDCHLCVGWCSWVKQSKAEEIPQFTHT